jgi:hypothetical protein
MIREKINGNCIRIHYGNRKHCKVSSHCHPGSRGKGSTNKIKYNDLCEKLKEANI